MSNIALRPFNLKWSERFPLRDAFTETRPGGGIYMWGFDDHQGEVIWYVGKAIKAKGVYRRLREHYLNLMSGQYQIPLGFLNDGVFQTAECSKSGWALQHGDTAIAETLADWEKLEPILRAGHRFANEAFARVALMDVPNDDLASVETEAIRVIAPTINVRRAGVAGGVAGTDIRFLCPLEDHDWLENWTRRRTGK